MNEWLKKVIEQLKTAWGKWSLVQKVILIVITVGVLIGIILLAGVSSSPGMVPLLNRSIPDEKAITQIANRLDQEGIQYQITSDQRILVSDESTAQKMRAILAREDLIPSGTDPWEIFDVERWTLTDFERNVNLRRAITNSLEAHITALDDVDGASVSLVMPETELFLEDQNPVTASIILTPKPGSDITANRKKIEGIVRLIQFAVEGLSEEYITVADHRGMVLNDFEDMADIDRLELARREMKTVRELETQYKRSILTALKQIYGEDRVEIINLDITMDLGKKVVETEEHFPIVLKEDNPRTPFDETEITESITLSRELLKEEYEGTGFNPEGPPGQEGQTPPAYKDLEGLVGRYSRDSQLQNEVVNTRNIVEEKSTWEVMRITVAVAIDGIWKWQYDDKGEVTLNADGSIDREYLPIEDTELAKARALIEHAIGYDRNRGDSVSVQHITFDRTEQFKQEDLKYRQRMSMQRTILYVLVAVAVLLIAFVAFRLVSREIEKRRRLREEELSRQHQAMREAALRSAEEESAEVEMSVEERARLEMQENAINMAREHPEDVAQLVKTWLMEE
jgi:flagellar M-ring protein FliF